MDAVWPRSSAGHLYEIEEGQDLFDEGEQPATSSGSTLTASSEHDKERWWAVMLSTGWTSREVNYGVDVAGDYGAYTTELSLRLQKLTLAVWSGFGTGNDYQEWDFTVAYTFELGPVFFTPGYDFSYQRSVILDEASEPAKEVRRNSEPSKHREAHHQQDFQPAHSSDAYGNEIFFLLGISAVPYVTPGLLFVSDLVNTPGAYLEIRFDGEIPLYNEVFQLQPYALLGINLGYNTTDYYGWNNFQLGLAVSWKLNRFVSIFGGINYSVALTALKEIDQGNEVWANAGVTFSY